MAKNNKIDDRKAGAIAIGIVALFVVAVVCLFITVCSSCSESSEEDWVGISQEAQSSTSSSSTQTTTTTTTTASTPAKNYSAPEFKSGTYTMEQESISKTEYKNLGSVYYTAVERCIYYYTLKISSDDDGIKCTYRFDRIYIEQSERYSGEEENKVILLDTDSDDYYSSASKCYYEIIGTSFTVYANSDGGFKSISGVDDIIDKHPSAAELISSESMASMARDLFFALPGSLYEGLGVKPHSEYAENAYVFSKLSRGNYVFNISGAAQEGYSYEDSSSGSTVVVEISKVEPASGTLLISEKNRAEQELNMIQKSSGTMSYPDEGLTIAFDYSYSSNILIY